MSRPAIPRQLERVVLIEAGHRCAIPTCRQPMVEIAHIVPYHEVKAHTFDNLIALCPNCHSRYDQGQIDRKSMQQYKTNLVLLNSRYGDLERRVLRYFAENLDESVIVLPKALDILVMYLLDDGLLKERPIGARYDVLEQLESKQYELTQAGREFIRRWLAAETLQ